jgi:DUF4097 and DUF4098 domain-containing protein YvlB
LKQLHKLAAVVLLVAPLALAQQGRVYSDGANWTQEINGTLGAAKNLRVKVESGTVKVMGGGSQDVSYAIVNHSSTSSEDRARRQFESYKITASLRGDTAYITAEWDGDSPHRFSSQFIVNVPQNLDSVKVETDGGNVEVHTIEGNVDAQSGGGSIRLSNIDDEINAETGGGNIDVVDAGKDMTLQTGGGNINISRARGKVNASSGGGSITVDSALQEAILETGGGSIHVVTCSGKVKASTGGGSIDLGDIGGPAEIETGGGSIRLGMAKGPVRAETGGGSIELNGAPSVHAETGAGSIIASIFGGPSGRSDSYLETSAGDITVYIGSSASLQVRASIEVASGHMIHSDFPEIVVHSDGNEWGPRTVTAEGSLHGGGPTVKIQTTTGDIYIRRGQQ